MNKDLYPERVILSIDLKSFFASCECVDRGLDPFSYPLVVANPYQGGGAITLAVTPYLKKQGVPSRGRIFEIPKGIKYNIVPPRMSLYIKKSKEVVSVYLDYIAREDLYPYSIDECFLDLTHYMKLYKKTDIEIAEEILQSITKKTGLTATCGIGPNILLAKIAMDTEAKKYKNGIAKWTYDSIQDKLWSISPLHKMWGIGPRMEKRLNALGIYKVEDLAKYDADKLKKKFGVMGTELWERANGIDLSVIKDLNNNIEEEKSYSNSQVLFKDYDSSNIEIIIDEMIQVVTKRVRENKKEARKIGLRIGYSASIGGGFYHVIKLDQPSDKESVFKEYAMLLFDRYYNNQPIRIVGFAATDLIDKESLQLNLFEPFEEVKKEDDKNEVIDIIQNKFGKNSLLKASSLLKDSTIHERNKKIGGHAE